MSKGTVTGSRPPKMERHDAANWGKGVEIELEKWFAG